MDFVQALQNAEFFEYTDISGCYVLKPNSFEIWENIKNYLDSRFKKLGIKNAYFPLFVSRKSLEIEKDHIAGFSPEVAWITKCGNSIIEKDDQFAVRPTSETIIYPHFAKWLNSHKQLPMKFNQWCNVVRWEFKDPVPFIRSREFLWQEMHSVHKSYEDAQEFVLIMLDLYEELYENLLGVPVIKGQKTELEKFSGGLLTTTIEAFIPISGKAIQAATSHNLGYSFGKMFNILYDAEDMTRQIPCQVSAGLTTRSIGVMALTHMDLKGIVIPPKVANTQIIVIPIFNKKVDTNELLKYTNEIFNKLLNINLRAELDDSKDHTPGWKYNYYENLGIPLRVEVGMNDLKNKTFRIAKRYNGQKEDINIDNVTDISVILDEIQNEMFKTAKKNLDSKIVKCTTFSEFEIEIKKGMMVMCPWKESQESEEKICDIMKKSGENIKTLCKPFDFNKTECLEKCFFTGEQGSCYVLWGKSY